MPFNMGWPEIVIILVIVIIIFGVGKLPQIGSSVGKGIREFKKELRAANEDDVKVAPISSEAESKNKS